MSDTPSELRYLATHEWARLDEDGSVTVGITDHAQNALGDVVFIELPDLEQDLIAGDEAGVVESVKAASDIFAPVSGTVIAVNDLLDGEPEKVNQDPYVDGWFYKVSPTDVAELEEMLDADGYLEVCESEEH
jgi:glycine cleavage system H protein